MLIAVSRRAALARLEYLRIGICDPRDSSAPGVLRCSCKPSGPKVRCKPRVAKDGLATAAVSPRRSLGDATRPASPTTSTSGAASDVRLGVPYGYRTPSPQVEASRTGRLANPPRRNVDLLSACIRRAVSSVALLISTPTNVDASGRWEREMPSPQPTSSTVACPSGKSRSKARRMTRKRQR